MQKFSFIFQSFFKLLLFFLFIFVWIRYFIKSFISSIVISAIITLILDIILRIFFKKHSQKLSLRQKEKEEAEDMFTSLAIDINYILFFEKVFSHKNQFKLHKKYISYVENDINTIVIPVLIFQELSNNEIAQSMKMIKKEKPQKVIFLTNLVSKECFNFINIYETDIVLLDKYQTYKTLYKENNIYPKINFIKQKQNKLSLKQLFEYSFNKARFKGYLFSAFALLFCSLFVRANLYYAIVTSILIIFAIISLINPFERTRAKSNKKGYSFSSPQR